MTRYIITGTMLLVANLDNMCCVFNTSSYFCFWEADGGIRSQRQYLLFLEVGYNCWLKVRKSCPVLTQVGCFSLFQTCIAVADRADLIHYKSSTTLNDILRKRYKT
jgi:hypothetical protein